MLKTPEGKVIVFAASTGQQLERWPVDAKLLLANGEATLEAPEGVDVQLAPPAPTRVGVQSTPVVTTPGSGDPGDPLKKAKAEK